MLETHLSTDYMRGQINAGVEQRSGRRVEGKILYNTSLGLRCVLRFSASQDLYKIVPCGHVKYGTPYSFLCQSN